jgi:tricorn protease
MTKTICAATALALAMLPAAFAESGLLLRTPTMNRTEVVFSYAGDLWSVPREGGDARRLTTSPGREIGPIFSPDGTMIAFTGEYDGNVDVYVMPANGGVPQRLTYHPGPDVAVAWTPDGKNILFSSPRESANDGDRFYTVPVEGGFPTAVPLPMAEEGSYSPDGSRLAYVPVFHWQEAWKRYRGGQTKPIWLVNLADSTVEAIPRDNSNDFNPMWVGDSIYFLSDRNKGLVSLFAYNAKTRKVDQLIQNSGLDMKSASSGPGGIVYEQFGGLYIYDFASRKTSPLKVNITGDFAEVRPHFRKIVAKELSNPSLSPTGARAVFEAHGEILSVPAEKGDFRNLTRSPGVADRTPAWSPDGKWISWFSDESGEYALHLREQNGIGEVKKFPLGDPHSFYYSPKWSPDSKKIALTDKWLNLWYIDVSTGVKTKVDTNNWDGSQTDMNPVWSPDSRWIAYTKLLPTYYHVILAYSLETGKPTQLTDGMSDAQSPGFDKNGKYLYFLASTDLGMGAGGGGGNMSAIGRPVTSSAYAMVLRKDLPSPLAPESDDENKPDASKKDDQKDQKTDAAKKDDKAGDKDKDKDKEPPKVTIDFDRISQRILALPIPARNYAGLAAAKEGLLFLLEFPEVWTKNEPPPGTLYQFDLTKRKVDKFTEGVLAFDISASGEKILFQQQEKWFISTTAAPPKPGEGQLRLDPVEVWVDPRLEWQQMYREAWKIEREFMYDPNYHGLDLVAAQKKYAPFVDQLDSRADLSYLFEEMLGELTLGHMFVGGGDFPEVKKTKTGLLGADYTMENGRYRFARVYDGENWNPELRAPLTQPGVDVKTGEYLLAVDGRDLRSAENLYSFFGESAGRQVVLKVGPNSDGSGSREVTVVPVDNEKNLRHLAWIEDNRRKVYAATGGRVAYLHVPDTALGGYDSFNRYYFAQSDKQGAIIDERFNHGGLLADYIVENMNRKILSKATSREGLDTTMPAATIYGPKVMITNQFAGSGGDALPWYFRKLGIGPLVGKRTWGGLVGIGGYPELMDGGRVMAPRWAIYGLTKEWEVENHGITPDFDVELDPAQWRLGRDSQLDKAIQVILELLQKNPPKEYQRPPYPNYHPKS